MIKVGVDLVSGEKDINILLDGCKDALKASEDIELVLIGPKAEYEKMLHDKKSFSWFGFKGKSDKTALMDRISFLDASEVVTMEDDPLKVVKQKKDSTIVKGLQAHKRMEIDAFFSPGNTGAIVVASALIMGRVPGIKKPALATFMPNTNGSANLLLDVGASTECDVQDLVKFAVIGRIFFREMMGVQNPKVALLNIGSESHKGTGLIQSTYKKLSEMDINFVGNVEGNEIFSDLTDIIVSDAMLGNTTLKVSEGAAGTLLYLLKDVIKKHKMAKYALPLYGHALKELKQMVDPEMYGGAPLLGVKGNIFIGHGSSGREAVTNGIIKAADAVRADVLGKIHRRLEELNLN